MRTQEIIESFDKNVTDRKTVDQLFELIERYVAPFRGEFFEDQFSEHQIDWRKPEIFDSTAIIASQILSSSMQGALTNPAVTWHQMRFADPKLMKMKIALEWLQTVNNIISKTIHNSNFNLEASEFYLDLTTFGTAIMTQEYEDNKMVYQAVPLREFYFDEGSDGKVINFYQELLWTPIQIADKLSEKDDFSDLPDKIREILINGNPTAKKRKFKVVFCIYLQNKEANGIKKMAPSKRAYGWKYVLHTSKEVIGKAGGYYEMPSYVTRWRKTSRSQWGFSPATVCLADILTLNSIAEVTLEALGKVVDPATLVTEFGLLSDLDLGRGGLSVVRSLDDIRPHESRARFDVGELKINNLQAAINRAFFVDQLEMKNSPAMTAMEVQVRYELMQRLLGPTLGRLKVDFLDPMLWRTFSILMREGKLPDMPAELSEAEMIIEYTGPLARSQRADVVQSVNQWIQALAQLKEIRPDIDDIVNYDEAALGTAIMLGVPADMINDEATMKEIRSGREAQQKPMRDAELLKMQNEAQNAQETPPM